MKDDHIRKLMLSERGRVKELLPSANQMQYLKYCSHRGGITAADLSQRFVITIQNSSTYLTRLFKLGYLKRTKKKDPTGGIYYFYELRELE